MKKILCIGNRVTYNLYKEGLVPSHWLYGVAEFEEDGFDVVNCEYQGNALLSLLADIYYVSKYHPDFIYIPFFNLKKHALLFLFVSLKWIRQPLITFVHRTPPIFGLSRYLMKGISAAFFLSPKNKHEVEESNLLRKEICFDAFWGPDLAFYDKYRSDKKENYFMATGKENRDYKLLIDVFSHVSDRLIIHTCHSHAGSNYDGLPELLKDKPNISIQLSNNSGLLFKEMLVQMSKSKCIVCPLLKDKMNYCVGLSSIADSMALGLPIIVTRNPYHSIDIQKAGIGFAVDSENDWLTAIRKLKNADYSEEVGTRARKLAEDIYNIKFCAKQIIKVLHQL